MMNEALVEEIKSVAATLDAAKDELKKSIRALEDKQGNRFTFDRPVAGSDYTLDDIFTGLSSLLGLVASIEAKENATFVPKVLLTTLSARANDIKASFETLRNLINTISANGGVKSIDLENLHVTAGNDAGHSFAKPFRVLFANLDAAYAAWYQVRFVLRAPRLSEFSKYVSEFESNRDKATQTLAEIREVRQESADKAAEIQSLFDRATASLAELQRIGAEGQADRKNLADYAADAANKSAEMKSAEEKAATLQETISNYQAQFEAFDKELAARSRRFEDETTEFNAIRSRLIDQEEKARKLTNDSETLLRGATNVGLASSFSSLQRQITRELNWARWGFYVSIFFLVVLSLPIAVYVFPALQVLLKSLGLNSDFMLPKTSIEAQKTPEVLAQIAARALLLVPGIWLVRFVSARHERLFRLREHYSYKFSVASSVEGFKKQAPELEQGIAATAFYELTFNPATRMDINSAETRYPNPAMEWIIKKLSGSQDKS